MGGMLKLKHQEKWQTSDRAFNQVQQDKLEFNHNTILCTVTFVRNTL